MLRPTTKIGLYLTLAPNEVHPVPVVIGARPMNLKMHLILKMEAVIAEIIRKIHSLPEPKVLEVLDFVDFLSRNDQHLVSPWLDKDLLPENEEFEAIADRLADEFQVYVGSAQPVLSDDAVSRAGIYFERYVSEGITPVAPGTVGGATT